jgi:ferredoxin-type protein NapF
MALSRRQFLRGNFAGRSDAIRPPWALAEEAFIARCTRCAACIKVCPSGVIVKGRGDYPRIDFARGECTFCGECVAACRDGALQRSEDRPPWTVKAVIGARCLARQDVVCRTCGDACGLQAIRFRPRLGGASWPELDTQACTGCGACVSVCPATAIAMANSGPAGAAELAV